jgi:hypothetical protein
MIDRTELKQTMEDHDKAFIEVSFLLDMFVDTIETFVGKSTPALAVASGRQMAQNMPIYLDKEAGGGAALEELVRVFSEGFDIAGTFEGKEATIRIDHCPIYAVCRERNLEINGSICQMFHYYIAGIMAELTRSPARPKTIEAGQSCRLTLTFSGLNG